MNHLEYKENLQHGTINFPFEIYTVDSLHPRYHMMHHWHNEHEIIRVISGSLVLNIDGNEFHAKAGDIVFLSGGMLHSAIPQDCNYECLLFNMRFFLKTNDVCNETIYEILENKKNIQLYFSEDMREAYQILQKMFQEMKTQNKGYQFRVQGYLYCLLGIIEKNNYYTKETTVAPSNQRRLSQLKEVLTYIESNYRDRITLDDLAKCVNMNRNYFCKFFKDMVHKTPVEYINHYRIECACEQISATDKTITEVAFDCGFNNLSYFIRVFKNIKGVTPYQFLKTKYNDKSPKRAMP